VASKAWEFKCDLVLLQSEECEQLRARLKMALKESEDLLLEKSETINKLSRNLEEAQSQCQVMINDRCAE